MKFSVPLIVPKNIIVILVMVKSSKMHEISPVCSGIQ